MASVDCRLISPQSPLRGLIVEPVQEGVYATYHGAKTFYAIYQRSVLEKKLPDFVQLAQGSAYILTGLSLFVPLINAVIFQLFVSVIGSYREALRDAVDKGDTKSVKSYLDLGVSPNNIYDTQALIFRAKNKEIIEALINAGADLSRTYSKVSFLEYLINEGMEDLAEKHFSRLSHDGIYANAISSENWAVAAFLVRKGESSLLGRERIKTDSKTKNPLEMLVIKGDINRLATLSKECGLDQMKERVKDLQKDFPEMKVDWIWTAILFIYCKDQMQVADETIYKLFKWGAFDGKENPLRFNKNVFLYWAGMQNREKLVDCLAKEHLLTVDSSDLEKLLENPTFLDCAIRLGYRGKAANYHCKTGNPLEEIAATQDAKRLETFVENHSFGDFYWYYLELKTLFPNMYTGWMWNVLYEIPNTHFEQFSPIRQSVALISPPPCCYPSSELLKVFDQINFDDPKLPYYIEEKALLETLDAARPILRTPSDIREGLSKIIKAIKTGFQVYRLEPGEIEGYRLQVQWIIYLLKEGLKKGPLPRDKANVLIDIGKACLMCPGRYNDIFDSGIKRLKNEKVSVVSFEDQVQRYYADLRSKILIRVAFKEAQGCTHSWENLVYHLHEERALQEPKPKRLFSSQMIDMHTNEAYHFVFKSDARKAFDAEYTPEEMMGVLSEFARDHRKRSQEDSDFNELMMESMIHAYSSQFPAIKELEGKMKERVAEKTLYEDQVLPIEDVEKLFRLVDPSYKIPANKETVKWSVAKHFADFKQAFFSPKIRPLTKDMMGYALPEVIHPLVMGKVLCHLRHLRERAIPKLV